MPGGGLKMALLAAQARARIDGGWCPAVPLDSVFTSGTDVSAHMQWISLSREGKMCPWIPRESSIASNPVTHLSKSNGIFNTVEKWLRTRPASSSERK